MPDPRIEIRTFPMLDTGLGREAGFKDDADMLAAAKARRAKLPAWQRELEDRIDRAEDDAFLNGTPHA